MPPAPMTMMGRTCFGRGCRASWTAARIRASRPSVAGGFGIGRSPSELFLKVARAQRRNLALTVLVVDKNFLRFDEGVSDGIPGIDAGISGAAGCLWLDWSDGGPYELATTGK